MSFRSESIKALVTESDGEISCSIEETNRIRALLGMKALVLNGDDTQSRDYQAVQNLKMKNEEERKRKEAADLADRLLKAKNKRLLNAKLEGATLSTAVEEEDLSLLSASDWVKRSRVKVADNQRLNEAREKKQSKEEYASTDLKGLKVMHDAENFDMGQEVILTLADSNILDVGEHGQLKGVKDDEDVLENVLLSDEMKRIEREKRAKRARQPVYSGYDDEEFLLTAAPGSRPSILSHYDKEVKAGPRLILGEEGDVLDSQGRSLATNTSSPAVKGDQSLHMEINNSSDYYTPAEFAKFNKPKKEKKLRKIRKRTEEDDEDVITAKPIISSSSSEPVDALISVESKGPVSASTAYSLEEDDADLQESLAKVRRLALKQKQAAEMASKMETSTADDGGMNVGGTVEFIAVKKEPAGSTLEDEWDIIDADGRRKDGKLIFTSTTEFTSRLQARLNEASRSRTEAAAREQELAMSSEPKEVEDEEDERDDDDDGMDTGAHLDEELSESQDGREESDGAALLQPEPLVSRGMAAALALLKTSGDLQVKKSRELAGRAKDARTFDPSADDLGIKLEYRDEFGRKLTQKEAFRQLSYRFHGYGPGKKKQEKRLKEMQAQNRDFTSKSSVDTGTMKSLTKTQEATGKAYVTIQVELCMLCTLKQILSYFI